MALYKPSQSAVGSLVPKRRERGVDQSMQISAWNECLSLSFFVTCHGLESFLVTQSDWSSHSREYLDRDHCDIIPKAGYQNAIRYFSIPKCLSHTILRYQTPTTLLVFYTSDPAQAIPRGLKSPHDILRQLATLSTLQGVVTTSARACLTHL